MTGDHLTGGTSAGRYRPTPQASADHIMFLAYDIDIVDVSDPSTWRTTEGNALNSWQRAQVERTTPEEWAQVEDLLALDLHLQRNELEQDQRRWLRLRARIDRDDHGEHDEE